MFFSSLCFLESKHLNCLIISSSSYIDGVDFLFVLISIKNNRIKKNVKQTFLVSTCFFLKNCYKYLF